jgi:hypothetical protein
MPQARGTTVEMSVNVLKFPIGGPLVAFIGLFGEQLV